MQGLQGDRAEHLGPPSPEVEEVSIHPNLRLIVQSCAWTPICAETLLNPKRYYYGAVCRICCGNRPSKKPETAEQHRSRDNTDQYYQDTSGQVDERKLNTPSSTNILLSHVGNPRDFPASCFMKAVLSFCVGSVGSLGPTPKP